MAFTPGFLDEIRARLSIADVVGRRVKLQRRGNESVGLCPFHSEKTPSFTVSDDKDFYHCFGCGAHGDVIKWVTETENLSFPEAVERLALEAGLEIPADARERPEERQKRTGTLALLDATAAWFQDQLRSHAGRSARDYLDRRGVPEDVQKKFRLGLATESRTALKDAMTARGFDENALLEAGLVIAPEDGSETYDRFRDRIIFPIADTQGRVIAFGGRALREARAKYLNSPETAVFHKGSILYNLRDARGPAREAGRLFVVEGYMDVIALNCAGIDEAVAGLGTALTEQHLALLWRVLPEPTLCFDGDAAGSRAAYRALDRALPLLKPGYSLRFAFLPDGQDPDDLVRSAGRAGFDDVAGAARSLSDVLWQRETSAADLSTPERRAGLEAVLDKAVNLIEDQKVRQYYRDDIRQRLKAFFTPEQTRPGRRSPSSRRGNWDRQGFGRPQQRGVSPELKRSRLAQSTVGESVGRELLLTEFMLNYPMLLRTHEEEYSRIEFETAGLDSLRAEILGFAALQEDAGEPLEREQLEHYLSLKGAEIGNAVKKVRSTELANKHWQASATGEAALADAEIGWRNVLLRHQKVKATAETLAAAGGSGSLDEEAAERIVSQKGQLADMEGDEASIDDFGLASGRETPI